MAGLHRYCECLCLLDHDTSHSSKIAQVSLMDKERIEQFWSKAIPGASGVKKRT